MNLFRRATTLKSNAPEVLRPDGLRQTGMLPYGIVLVVGILLAGRLGGAGYPCPRGDDAVYKSPAAELVQNGRLAIPCMSGFLPRSETAFASYPPVYQLLLSGWYLVFGFSLSSTLGFSYSVHLLSALAVISVAARLLEPNADVSRFVIRAILTAIGLIHLANLAYFDRPEETALLWIWLDVLVVQTLFARREILSWLASGALLGLAALTAPWVGVLGALVITIRGMLTVAEEPRSRRRAVLARAGLRIATAAVVAASMVGIWYATMERLNPGIIDDQFFGTIRFLEKTQGRGTLGDKLGIFLNTVFFNHWQLPTTALILVFWPVAAASTRGQQGRSLALALYITGVCGIVCIAVLRPTAYTYLGVTQMLMLPCFGPAIVRFLSNSVTSAGFRIGMTVIAVCTMFAYRDVARLSVLTWRLPHAERPGEVFDRLTAVIPPGELVAVTPRHWHAFQGRNPWREAYFSSRIDPQELLRCRWLVLYPGVGRPDFIDAFEIVEKLPASGGYKDGTYAYSLWRRKE